MVARVARLVAARLFGMMVTLLAASFVIFAALHVAPGSPIDFLSQGRTLSPEAIAALERQYHLGDPFLKQYVRWLVGTVQGDFGVSIFYNVPVAELLTSRAVNTLWLIGLAWLIIVVTGLAVGVLAGLRPGLVDTTVTLVATLVMAVPAFVTAVVLIFVFSVALGWLPAFGPGTGFLGRIEHTVLPAISLALLSIGYLARQTRVAVRQELDSEHVVTAVSRGLPQRLVQRKHVLRNASVPTITTLGLTIPVLLATSVIVEQVFQLNGLGSLLITSVQQQDFAVVQAISLLYVATFIVLNTVVDLVCSLLDPRITLGGKQSS